MFPVQVDDRFRILSSYWTKQQDKAISIAFDNFIRKRSPDLTTRAEVTTAELPSDLMPVRRYFERRFVARHLHQGEQVLRTEIWSGTAPIPLRGAALDRATVQTRLDFLKPYYLAPVEDRFPGESYPPYYAFEREGDIVWLLQYFEQR